MKFGDLLKTIGIVNKVPRNSSIMTGHNPHLGGTIPGVDRIFNVFQKHQQMPNPYLVPTGLGASAAVYNPMVYNIPGQHGYGLKLGAGHNGYEPNAYGPPPHGGVGSDGGVAGPQFDHSSYSKHKSKGSSAMSALTLLSFFFFINLLQNCLKEHMETMNPTVMVMTTGVARIHGNKFKEMYRPVSKEESFGGDDSDIPVVQHESTWKRADSKRRAEGGKITTQKLQPTEHDDNERFTYPNRTTTQTKQKIYHQFHTHHYSTRDRAPEHKQEEIRNKVGNDFPNDDDSAYFTRIH